MGKMIVLHVVGFIGAAIVMVLPGVWLAYGTRAGEFDFWTRLAMATVLSPIVVLLQFHALQWVGMPFETIAVLVPVFNLPAAWLAWRAWEKPAWPQMPVVLAGILVLALPVIFLSPWVLHPAVRANWGHAWYHAGLVYRIAAAGGFPEEPQLAGIALAYPWTPDLFRGLLSVLIDKSPNSAYIWTNMAWLMATLVLVVRITAALGGTVAARILSVVWLCFGINALGPVARALLPESVVQTFPIWGDFRYSPWVVKYAFFTGTALGTSIVAALALVAVRPWSRKPPRLLTAALLVALAGSYPLLFPAGVLLVASRAVVDAGRRRLRRDASPGEGVRYPLGTILVGCAAFAAVFSIVTATREGAIVLLPTLWRLKIKAATSLVVLAPLALGAVVAFRLLDREQIERGLVLAVTAIGCVAAYMLFDIEFRATEYNYVFQVGVCLAPLAAIASQRAAARLGRAAIPALALLAIALAWPAGARLARPAVKAFGPAVETSHFRLALQDGEPFAAVTEAIRSRSPDDAVLVTGPVDLDLAALTGRAVYVPVNEIIFGLELTSDDLLTRTLGYPRSLVMDRRERVKDLFASGDPAARAAILDGIRQELHRSLVVIIDVDRDRALDAWLGSLNDHQRLLHRDGRFAAWMVDVAQPASSPNSGPDRR